MKRLRGVIFIGLTTMSLLLCVATVVLWVRSYRNTGEAMGIGHNRVSVSLIYVRGTMTFATVQHPADSSTPGWRADIFQLPVRLFLPDSLIEITDRMRWRFAGISFANGGGDADSNGREAYFTAPQWVWTTIFLALPLFQISRRWRQVHKKKRSDASCLCHMCGYDLRATPNRCPECGTIAIIPES